MIAIFNCGVLRKALKMNQPATIVGGPTSHVPPYSYPVKELLASVACDEVNGLTDDRVAELRDQHGRNELAELQPIPLWRKLLSQFQDLVIVILNLAALISGVMGKWVDSLAILAIVVVNA